MITKFIFLTTLIFFSYFHVCAQADFLYYFDKNFNSTSKEHSVFTGYGRNSNGLTELTVKFNEGQNTVMIANYTDSSLSSLHGSYKTFFIDGIPQSQGIYQNNLEAGLWIKWDSAGNLTDSILFEKGKELQHVKLTYLQERKVSIYDFRNLASDEEHKIFYTDSGKILSEVFFKGEKGIYKTYKAEEVTMDSVFTKEEIEASYPGGEKAWTSYVTNVVRKNIEALTDDGKSGTCLVKFIINSDGTIGNVKATTMIGSKLAKIAVQAIEKGAKWNPARYYGKAVKAYRIQPFTFTISYGK